MAHFQRTTTILLFQYQWCLQSNNLHTDNGDIDQQTPTIVGVQDDTLAMSSNSDDQLSTEQNIIVNSLPDSDSRPSTLPEVSVEQLPEPSIIVNSLPDSDSWQLTLHEVSVEQLPLPIIVNHLPDSDSLQLTLHEVSVEELPEQNIIVNILPDSSSRQLTFT